ncbi:MAG TPA: ROK family transcriptional regulator [Gaiellaceae bacterium]|nr:ROK family transcriptional regulator [Gaiellaceae bacterium]
MSVRATPPLLKDMNERTVLEAIRASSPISRAEISRRVGISKPTVSLALQSLLDAGLVREAEPGGSGPRYGATFFEPVAEAAHVVGIDLGARFVRGALADLQGGIRARQDVDLGEQTAAAALLQIEDLVASLLAAADVARADVDGVVLGVPGAVQRRDIRLATNVSGLEGSSFATDLTARLALPLTLENDINLAALGEREHGVARGVDDFAFISIGTGLGTGLVLRGELHRGHHGTAGELDYFRAGLGEELDPCAGAVSAYARELAELGDATTLVPPYEPREVFSAARAGDRVARAVVAEEARRIALHVAPIAAVADVRLVVLGGGIGANGDLLHDRVRSLLAEWLPYPPRVEGSSLGDAAVLMGALSVGLRDARENVFVNRNSERTPEGLRIRAS